MKRTACYDNLTNVYYQLPNLITTILLRTLSNKNEKFNYAVLSPTGEPGGDSLAGTFCEKRLYIWVPFLDLEDNKILSMGGHL